MRKHGDTVTYTADEVAAMLERGEDLTDWARVDALTEEELEASIDFEEEGEIDWSTVQVGLPDVVSGKVSVPIERDLVAWFAQQPGGIETSVNKVLRSFVATRQPSEPIKR